MGNLKVWTFHSTVRNAIIFVLMSLFFIILQRSLQSNLPFMNHAFLLRTVFDEWLLLALSLTTTYLLIRHRPLAKWAYLALMVLITFRSLESLILSFNKVVMILLFCQVCMAYAFYQLLDWTYSLSIFRPNFYSDQLDSPMALQIKAEVKIREKIYEGYLTNWDAQGAFIYLDKPWEDKRKNVMVEVAVKDHRFGANGTVVTATWDKRGIGLEWSNKKLSGLNSWDSLIELFDDYGWVPELLR